VEVVGTPRVIVCRECGHDFSLELSVCPHCYRPCAHYPNVTAAQDPGERQALQRRHAAARDKAQAAGVASVFDGFEEAVGQTSVAVVARPMDIAVLLMKSTEELWPTYHQMRAAGLRRADPDYGVPRTGSEEALFPGYKEQIHSAALSLDGIGAKSYGECSISLREAFIAHRASVFEENNVLWTLRRKGSRDPRKLPKGRRAQWGERGVLAATKLADQLAPSTTAAEFAGLLLQQGATTDDDSFVEVHIYGSLTVRAVEKVTLTTGAKTRRQDQVRIRALTEALREVGASLETSP
jgi:hypothetical protein